LKLKIYCCLALIISSNAVFSENQQQTKMNLHGHKMQVKGSLSEAGNDAFGTVQEVIVQLNNNPNTDWKKVNIEALRRHLLDMNDMTVNVEVISQENIPNGLKAIIKATTKRAALALERVFKAHPAQLQRETGWKMTVQKQGNQYVLTIVSENSQDIDKIRGLGYIGLMAYGNHHQPHHWGIATGSNPHAGHHK